MIGKMRLSCIYFYTNYMLKFRKWDYGHQFSHILEKIFSSLLYTQLQKKRTTYMQLL